MSLRYITNCIKEGAPSYSQMTSDVRVLSMIIAIIYFIYLVIFRRTPTIKAAFSMGIIFLLIAIIISNTMVIVRPELTDIYYWINIFQAFAISFILPFSEKKIKEIIFKKSDRNTTV